MQNLFAVVGAAALFALGVAVGTQDESKKPPVAPPMVDAAKQDADAPGMPKPGPEHKWLAEAAGNWKCETLMLQEDMTMGAGSGTEKVVVICHGLWVMSDFECTTPLGPFKGHGVMGYDPHKKQYVGTWVDSWTTSTQSMVGQYDKEKKVFTAEMTSFSEQTQAEVKLTQITTFKSDKQKTFEIKMKGPDGSDMTVFKIEYTRV